MFEQIAQIKKIYDIRKKLAKDDIERERLENEERLAIWSATFDAIKDTVSDVLGTLSENSRQRSENRITQLEQEKQKELDLAGNNAAAREAIEKRYQDKVKQEKIKQAQREKSEALFQIAVQTAIGAARAIAASPLTFGMPFLAFVLIQGAIQAALVASRPLPKYKKGRKGGPAELAIVDEAGPELIIDKHGRLKEVGGSGERATYLDKGDSVIPHVQTKEILRNVETRQIIREMELTGQLSSSIRKGKQDEMIYVMAKAMQGNQINERTIERAFKEAVKEIPIYQTIIDEKGQREREKTVNSTTTYLNNLTKIG